MIKQKVLTLLVLLAAVVTGARAAWTGGTYTATANENLNAITVSDDATLTINADVTVTVTGGIVVADGKTLTITGGGTLVAYGGTGQTGNAGGTAIAGNVIINGVGLTVTATGGQGGPGGQGAKGANGGSAFSGAVTIYAGSVTATGGQRGWYGNGGDGGDGGDSNFGNPGSHGDPGEDGEDGANGYAYANSVTFEAATYTVKDNSGYTINLNNITSEQTVIIQSADVEPVVPYSVALADGTEDATNWTITPAEATTTGVAAGTEVKATYGGTKRVKSVKAVKKASAGPVTYTELKGGEVLHVGDIINLSEEISFNHGDYYMGSYRNPYTVVRADLTIDEYEETVVNEKADGNYYVIKANDGGYYHFVRALGVTDKSDGILVTYNGKLGSFKDYTFTVHEP